MLILIVWMGVAGYALLEFARYILFVDQLSRMLGGQRPAADPASWMTGLGLILAGLVLPGILARRAWRRIIATRD
ncbi:MAG: hypothetical protein EOP61_02150 [Sphingomonadales bacterium]|nr:MAG: hypothetical protein EOP61_02150 [Sphingomonadales bacterium]